MPKFTVKFYKGDYGARQIKANADKAIVYIEHHFNGGSATADYALANIATNGSQKSFSIAKAYVKRISDFFNCPLANNDFATFGVSRGGYMRRGNANLINTNMPAVLLEPLFATNPKRAAEIRTDEGQLKLAVAIAETITEHFPNGGLIAFSVGHKYKTSNPNDRGVQLAGGGSEADYAETVLLKAQMILEKMV